MIDISRITSLISAFRAETQRDSITPESLGYLLQSIVDLLANAAVGSDVETLRVQLQSVAQSVSDEVDARRFADVVINGYLEMKADKSALADETAQRERSYGLLSGRIDNKVYRYELTYETVERKEYDHYLLSLHNNPGGSTPPPSGGGTGSGSGTGGGTGSGSDTGSDGGTGGGTGSGSGTGGGGGTGSSSNPDYIIDGIIIK